MGNIRINKLALELNVQNDQIIEELQKNDIHVKNYMSAIDDDMAEKIRAHFSDSGKEDSSKKLATSKTKKAAKSATKSTSRKKQLPQKRKRLNRK